MSKVISHAEWSEMSGKEKNCFTGTVKYESGAIKHYVDGKYHCDNVPAVAYPNGDKYYYCHGRRHRLDGPAVDESDGRKEYYIDNIFYSTKEKFEKAVVEFLKNNTTKKVKTVNSTAVKPQSFGTVDVSDWKAWAKVDKNECPCKIPRHQCNYHS